MVCDKNVLCSLVGMSYFKHMNQMFGTQTLKKIQSTGKTLQNIAEDMGKIDETIFFWDTLYIGK